MMATYNMNDIKIQGGNTIIGSVKELNVITTPFIDFEGLFKDIQSIKEYVKINASERKDIIDVLIELERAISNKESTKIQQLIQTSRELLKDFSISAGASYLVSIL